ncbi:response regulator transcription factor [Anaeromicrobium sediminis]|uniref:Stage 0 sporulation protein A homolog n=1 Tax=Anaeromicrobium sediminis TaxID=1478221 RepID=A0A267MB40_9FIRM|nr:helix-turn-helix domain-containing protein [Anaeromicrobium sediminis]PAB56791.1 hypothetical protein CCE28_20160 [Anaeromicrobium sediminis]
MLRALVVDDEKSSGEIIKYLVNMNNFPIEIIGHAYSGDEAIDLIHKLKPQVVFIDIQMPVYNGLQVMEKINSSYDGAIKFIVITAYAYFEYAQQALRLGAKDILLKPIDNNQFIKTIKENIDFIYTKNETFNEIINYINNNYEKNLELNKCAQHFYLSPNHLSRMFKKYLNKNFITYLNELRIKKAQELLIESNLTIQEISHLVGYNNLNYFYRNFKQCHNTTPKKFREKHSTILYK